MMSDKHAWWKFLILVGLIALSMVFVYPPKEKIRLGLDLQGGTSFTVTIDEDQMRKEQMAENPNDTPEQVNKKVKAILDKAQERALEVLRNRVDNLGISEPIIYPGKDNRIIIQLPGADDAMRAEAKKTILSVAVLEFKVVHEKNDELVSRLFDQNLAPEGYIITQVGNRTGYKRDPSFPEEKRDAEYRKRLSRFKIPDASHEFLLQKEEEEGEVFYRPVYVKWRSVLKGDRLANARVDYRGLGQPVVLIAFDSAGSRRFRQVTQDLAPPDGQQPTRRLAIVLDGTLYSAPYITEPINGGKAEISGSFTPSEAILLSNILKAGALPAPVKIIEQRTVSPSLGTDSINSGVSAVLYGGVGVILFMLLYYRISGVVANLALVLNVLVLPLGMVATAGFLGIFSGDGASGQTVIKMPVLTLPGIAGIVLTVGMAVDANVLIFERIREELEGGKRVWAAVTAGFDRAFITILDSNLTTLLAAVILFVLGEGPIRGFAVTLCAGILVSMYTALTVTKLFFDLLINKMGVKSIKMMKLISGTSIDFLGKRAIAVVLSTVIIAGSLGYTVYKTKKEPGSVFGVDFTGGAAVTFNFTERKSIQEIRDALDKAGVKDAHIQYQKEFDASDEFLHIKTGTETVGDLSAVDAVKIAIAENFGDAGYKMLLEDEVGAQIGKELQKKALLAVIIALLGMILYITIRFELGFAAGAITALAHDVLITIGIFAVLGRPFSLTFVAALLTIVGYSINDTIVIFDRIREDLKIGRSQSFKEICNLSINQTLGRTILTSATTLITVVMLLVFGGGAINDFALALFIGIIAGTYSTIFIATPTVLALYKGKKPAFAQKGA